MTAFPQHNASEAEWHDWRWQMRHRVHDLDTLARYIRPTASEREAVEKTAGIFRWTITPYYASLMDPVDPNDPIRQQVVPQHWELAPDIVGVVDPLDEVGHSPVKNLIHNYPDRVAFCVTSECAIYCRYCLRKRMVGDADFMMRRGELEEAIAYIAAHPAIRDVLLTGGDPLVFSDANLDWLLGKLRAIRHVEIVRLGSRLPVVNPFRITPELAAILKKHHPVWLNTHFNHPNELTPEAAEACARLAEAGVPVGNQSVLLRGINDDPAVMKALSEGLVAMRVRPYYVYQAQLIGGTAHLRTTIEEGMHLMRRLRGHTSGFAVPTYVLDTPDGKVPLTRDYVLGRAGDHVVMETTRGTLWAEPNPIPEGRAVPLRLPEIEMPAEAKTIPTGAPTFIPVPGGYAGAG
ncbi:MAG TPA: KamA family radical SAM protein [Rubricoccaceae bacterium]|nr:KamA family radical SAM protein [Rubricoccaceae bacterium]